MTENDMRFGEYIKQKRLADPRELTMMDVAKRLGVSVSYYSDVEKGRRKPFVRERLEQLASFLNLPAEDTAELYDLAGRENRAIPFDIEDTLMNDDVGDLARFALRQTKAGFIERDDWQDFISNAKNRKQKKEGGGNDKT